MPAFYFLETSSGQKGIVGTLDPRRLRRIQKPSSQHPPPKWDQERKLFHAIYWSGALVPDFSALPDPQHGVNGGFFPISSENTEAIREHFSAVDAYAAGDEELLDAAISAGLENVQVVLWDASDRRTEFAPWHRVVKGVEWFQSGWMVCLAREHFFFRDVSAEMRGGDPTALPYRAEIAAQLLIPQNNESVVMLAVTKNGSWRVHSEKGWADGVLSDLHPSLREISVVQLQQILLPKALSLQANDGSQEERVSVFSEAAEAVSELGKGGQAVYLLNPIHSEQLRDLIKHGQMLPARSFALNVATPEVLPYVE